MGGVGSGARPRITDTQVNEMRRLKLCGWTNRDVAREFGCSFDTVQRLTNGRGRVPPRGQGSPSPAPVR